MEDLRYALRLALRRPTLTLVTILTLAIGIGGNTAIFSVANGLLLRPMPVPDADRIVRVFGTTDVRDFDVMSYPNASDLATRAASFASMAIHQQSFGSFGLGEATETAAMELVSGNYFSTLRIAPARGRVITPEDDELNAGQRVAVISDSWWRSRLGGLEAAVGSTVYLNGTGFLVIGVAPATFHGSYDALGTDIWVPLMTYSTVRPRGTNITSRGWGWLSATARLKPAVSIDRARAEAAGIAADLRREYPRNNKNFGVTVVPATALPEEMTPTLRRILLFALVVVGLALAAACANIANAQLAMVIHRQREIAVRLAMGASRTRVVRQWLTESLLIGALAAASGLLLAVWARDALFMLRPPYAELQNLWPDLSLDWRVLTFTAVVTTLVTMLVGTLPAARAARVDVISPLKEDGIATTGGRRRSYAQGALVVAQVAVSLALLVSAGLLVRSLGAASRFDVGLDTTNQMIAQANTTGLNYDPPRTRAYYRAAADRIRALPGVTNVTYSAVVPLGGSRESRGVIIDGYTPPDGGPFVSIGTNLVATNYFQALGIPIVRGRGFEPPDGDDAAHLVAVVNETMAQRFWPAGNAIGQQLRLGGKEPPAEIVGVAKDTTYYAIGETPQPYFYLPFGPVTMGDLSFQVRTAGANTSLPQMLRRELRASDPRVRAPLALPYEELRAIPLYPGRAMAIISSAFGLLALLLTTLGLYGVVAYAVSQRTREFALRMALGARPIDIARGVLRQGMVMTAVGIAAGAGMALLLSRLLRTFLFGVSGFDPLTFGVWTAALIAVALGAAYIPARRAVKIDPAAALTGRGGA